MKGRGRKAGSAGRGQVWPGAKWKHKKAVPPLPEKEGGGRAGSLGRAGWWKHKRPWRRKKMSQSLKQGRRAPFGAQAATNGFVARLRSHTPERGARRPCGPEPTSGVVGLLLRLRSAVPYARGSRFGQGFSFFSLACRLAVAHPRPGYFRASDPRAGFRYS